MADYNKVEKNVKRPINIEEEVIIEEKVKLEPVTKGKVKKKGLIERLVVGLLGPDGVKGIASHVNQEIIKPEVKNMAADALKTGIDMLFYRDGGAPTRGRTGGNYYTQGAHQQSTKPKTNYRATAPAPSKPYSYSGVNTGRGSYVEEYALPTRNEAMDVLDSMHDQLERYGSVSVADYYDLISIEPRFTDNQYGWTDLSSAQIRNTRNGFIITLPALEVV